MEFSITLSFIIGVIKVIGIAFIGGVAGLGITWSQDGKVTYFVVAVIAIIIWIIGMNWLQGVVA